MLQHRKGLTGLDELMMRIAETETQCEELDKENGRMRVLLEKLNGTVQTAVRTLEDMQNMQKEIIEAQTEQRNQLHSIQRQLNELTARTEQLDEAADVLEANQTETAKTVDELSHDMDALYEDMNMLSKETRNRCAQMRADMHRFFYDATEHRYEDDAPTMWKE